MNDMTIVPGLRPQAASTETIRAERLADTQRLQELGTQSNKVNRSQIQVSEQQTKIKRQQQNLSKQELNLQRQKNELLKRAQTIQQATNRLKTQMKTASGATEIVNSKVPLPSKFLNKNPTEEGTKIGLYIDAAI